MTAFHIMNRSIKMKQNSAQFLLIFLTGCLWLLTTVLADAVDATHRIRSAVWTPSADEAIDGFFSTGGHTNNWAVLVDTSRFWFNYRHIANTLSMYRTVKRLGIPDSNIILMLADDVACNPRNTFPATVFNNNNRFLDLYGSNVEVDYRGYEVTVENFIRLLTNRVDPSLPRSKRLLTDDRSNILVFMTGHGGEDFLKFQDNEEIASQDLADAFAQMYEKKRYHEIFFLIDTCQAASMYSRIYSPNILAAASSLTGEPSYSHHVDYDIGVAVIDRFTYYNLEVLEKLHREDPHDLQALFATYDPGQMLSHVGVRQDLFRRPLDKTLVTDFFGGVQSVELTSSRYPTPSDDSISLLERNDSLSPLHQTFSESSAGIQSYESSLPKTHNHLRQIRRDVSMNMSPSFLSLSAVILLVFGINSARLLLK